MGTFTRFFFEWAAKSPVSRAMTETGLSRCAVLEWYRLLRDFLFDFEFESTSKQIAGAGMTVEIDETKVVRRKYNPPTRSGWWVAFAVKTRVVTRTQGVLNEVVLRHVAPGTRILSDCWAGYNGLSNLGYEHATKQKGTNIQGSLEGYFAEYMFRKEHEADVFGALLSVIARETCCELTQPPTTNGSTTSIVQIGPYADWLTPAPLMQIG
uniref:ISXO2-like transposase domain-containing protein n=1 Tax=Anopheles stephensi TaxID=30069 RepID=A0A182YRH5_ANOST